MLISEIVEMSVLGLILLLLGAVIGAELRRNREKQSRERLEDRIHCTARWLCADFPIVEDIETFLLESEPVDVQRFRDRMNQKHGWRALEKLHTIITNAHSSIQLAMSGRAPAKNGGCLLMSRDVDEILNALDQLRRAMAEAYVD